MRGISLAKIAAVILVIGLLSYLAYSGIVLFNNPAKGQALTLGAEHIRQGLDLKGGVYIVYQPDTDKEITPQQMDSAKEVIQKRLDSKALFDSNVIVDSTNNRLIVEIPGETNAQKAVQDIGKTAKLQFRDSDGNVVIEGNDIVDAGYEKNENRAGWKVTLKFSSKAAGKFAEATGRVSQLPDDKNRIGIYLDEVMISNPSVSGRIDGGSAEITGDFTADEAKETASLIRSGALPFSLKPVQVEGIGPILGQQALNISIKAGMIAFVLVCIYMIAWYRLSGIVASFALTAYVAVTIIILSGAQIALTLPGIAGIILSVGMAVDANILIFERVKEELRAGKTLRGAVELGFKRAFTTIVDANITTMIVGALLFLLGTGPIRGFAITLMLGVALSFLSAITLTRYMLVQTMGLGLRQPWLYGNKGGAVNA